MKRADWRRDEKGKKKKQKQTKKERERRKERDRFGVRGEEGEKRKE